ncbi:MAG: thioredoxin domain-containing protein [Oligoflexia bacterium]|nr:thioredoxin domain-containing protein [Oligoflexia bacterium]
MAKDTSLLQLQPDDHRIGRAKNSVVLIEYADFECPFCGAATEILSGLRKDFGNLLCFVFRHFPLAELHEHALLSARASEAASRQGKFWTMHDALFDAQDDLSRERIVDLAGEIGLDLSRFEADLESDVILLRVQRDILSGTELGVDGTPTLFIDGELYRGSLNPEYLSDAIEAAMKKRQKAA